jgi:4-carboxymuconolactone decarboxylase
MDVLKSVGAVLLAGIVGVLPEASIQAQNPVRNVDSAVSADAQLPKDIYPDSRNRLPLPKREDMDDSGKQVFDQITRGKPLPDGSVPAGFLPTGTPQAPVRLWDPKLAKLLADVSHYRKYEIGLPDRLLEIAVLVTAYEMNCQYEWTQWERFGRNPSDPRHIEQSTIDIIKYNKPVVGLGEKETAVITFGREMFGQRKVSSETFAEVLRLFDPKGTLDLLELMAGYSAAAAELTAFDQQLQVGQKPLLPPRILVQAPVRNEEPADVSGAPLPKDVYPDSRNRFPVPKREDMDDNGKKAYDQVNRGAPAANGAVRAGFFPTGTPAESRVTLWDPELAGLMIGVGHYLKYETGLSDQLMEIAILVTARELDCQYEWTQWERFGRNPSDPRHIEQSAIDIIKYERPVVGFGEKETAIVALGREMFGRRQVSSGTFAEVLRLFGRKGTVDLVWLMANYSIAAAQLTALDQQLQVGQKPLLPPR